MDRTKHESDVQHHLFLLQFSHRFDNKLCIFCGVALKPDELASCDLCRETRRQKRIAEAGYDWMEDIWEDM